MFENIPLRFEQPTYLLLLILLVPVVLMARRSWNAASPQKAWSSLLLRCLVVVLLTASLSQPTLVKRGKGLSLTIIADRSASIPTQLRDRVDTFVSGLPATKKPDDRIGTIVVASGSEILSRPEQDAIVPKLTFLGDKDATDLASGVALALAMATRDTANRILLISDGNENRGSLLKAAEAARAANIPIDVIVLEYAHPNEVVFESIQAPTRTRVGATQNLRLFMRSQSDARGRLTLLENGKPVDLDLDSPSDSIEIELKAGPNIKEVPISFDEGGAVRFEAVFEPYGENADSVLQNNVGTAVTFVAGGGKLLILDVSTDESSTLAKALREGGLSVDVRTPDEIIDPTTALNGYDVVILANVPKWAIDPATDRALRSSVHDMGIGFMMLGGPESFGAGGWMDSEVEKMLPVKLDPPASRQLVRGALALIVHACEFAAANYWSAEVCNASIKTLSRLDLIGIVTFMGMGGGAWHFPLQEAGDKSAAFAAVKSMVVGDMSEFETSVNTAYVGLAKSSAGQKHIIIISDGDPAPPSRATLQKCKDAKITISTVMLSGGLGHGTAGDYASMKDTANFTGGRFHEVKNPKQLPQIFTKEATVVTRSLISEGDYKPQVSTSISGPLKGISAVPGVRGYIVTVARQGLAQTPILIPSKDGNDPLFAWWNYGIGRSVAFTSDATHRWGEQWTSWSDYRAFWEQTVRWLMRPPSPSNIAMRIRLEGETAVVEVEAIGDDNTFINFLSGDATVLDPEGNSKPLDLQQIGPGRYRAEFAASETGGYLVNLTVPVDREGQMAASSVQAALNIAYPKEFRAVQHNAALLHRVADETGGRVMTLGDPALANAFDRTALPMPRSAKRVWDLMAYLAAVFFLADVAVRRLALERGVIRRFAERILGRTEHVGESTVAAWKTARRKAGHAGDRREGADGTGSAEERRARADATRTAAATRFDGDESAALDVAGETKGEPGTRESRLREPASPTDELKPATPEDPHTSRLLRAKRRAQHDTGGDSSGNASRPDSGAGPDEGGKPRG
ncbi:MAG: VWA domain-containing protein [Phycisphaerae bacterium]|nr:VWA domain-containing protein [Phycisphaerae bacterium]